jgi:hypothetical protein
MSHVRGNSVFVCQQSLCIWAKKGTVHHDLSHKHSTGMFLKSVLLAADAILQAMSLSREMRFMASSRSVPVSFMVVTGLALLLAACGGGGGGGSSSGGSGALSLSVTDAPVSDADISAVWVRFTSVIVKADGNGSQTTEVPVSDNLGNNYIDIDLKSLSGGNAATLLGQYALPAGHYSWMRLVIDPAHTYVVETGGGVSLLECSSCDESHLKLNRSFTIQQGGVMAFTIDFDLRKSITLTGPQTVPPRPDYAYKLRPTLRIVQTALAGNFSGEVDKTWISGSGINTDALMAGDSTGCSVYVFDGSHAVPDDVYFPDTGSAAGHINPVVIADVKVGTGGTTFVYTAAFLPAGDYTAALTCESGNDDPLTDQANTTGGDPGNEVIFLDQQNVTVQSGTTTENVDFPAP